MQKVQTTEQQRRQGGNSSYTRKEKSEIQKSWLSSSKVAKISKSQTKVYMIPKMISSTSLDCFPYKARIQSGSNQPQI